MNKLAVIASLSLSVAAVAAPPVTYELSFDNAAHHEAQITVTYTDIGEQPLQLRMSRTSPGRYSLHEFAKNVYSVSVVDGAGQPLTFSRPSPYQWDVAGHDGTVSMTYTLYADRASGTYSGIDLTHAHLNMPATLMWARGFDDRAVSVAFRPAVENWKVATQLVPTDDPYVFTAPNLQYLMDSPAEFSNFSERSWQVESNGRSYKFRLTVHHNGIEEDVDVFAEKARKVIAELTNVYGELPNFDYGTYTFICDFLPYVNGDGMEHRNSTIIASPTSLIDADFKSQIATLSHEFFHAWNVERIRPKGLEPFDFEQTNMSSNLWFAEGFTSYYGPLAIRRAGEDSVDEFLEKLAAIINTVTFSPGRSYDSSQGMSMQAPFVDRATSNDPTNHANAYVDYYYFGAAIGLALDLTLRDSFKDITLDTMMRRVWGVHGQTEVPYSTDDLRDALAHVSGDRDFANDFFARFIAGQELADYESLLDHAGLILRKANEDASSAGPITLMFEGKAAIIQHNTIIDSPIYISGLDRGDQIVAIDRLKIQSQEQWDAALERYEPGDTVTIHYIQREVERSAELTFVENNTLEIVTYESDDRKISRSKLVFRKLWLGPESDE